MGGGAAAVGTSLQMGVALRTGPKSRLQVTFKDNSTLTLGENAKVTVDKFVYNPQKSTGALALNSAHGAFRFAGGKLEQMKNKKVTITTPSATLGIRGTDFWAGNINGKYGVLLLKGRVRVSGQAR